MKVLVTGADGFVGKWTCAELLGQGHQVLGGLRASSDPRQLPIEWRDRLAEVQWVECELRSEPSVAAAFEQGPDAIIHLAAVASGAEARARPVEAWRTNCLGTCELLYAAERLGFRGRLVFASTGEVYGAGLTRPALETDPVRPCSPYAASKAAAEQAVLEAHRRAGMPFIVARPFAQTGPGQREVFVASAWARRIRQARQIGAGEIVVGNLEPVREFLDVRDVASALCVLLARGASGGIYNIARGEGVRLAEVFALLAELLGWAGRPVADSSLFRQGDIPYLVGDGSAIAALGWKPVFELRTTLADLVASL
jgi:GDP-4-dehydro-6-deoxy-D-mannose reductase